jgi:hypothetical protein
VSPIFIPISLFVALCWIVWTIATNLRRTRVARLVADTHARVLDKCAAGNEMISYLESEAARKFLDSAATETANPAGRILNAFQTGIILTLVGIAGFLLRLANFERDADRFLLVVGAIAFAVGVGFLISAATSLFLCRSWGLLVPAELRK